MVDFFRKRRFPLVWAVVGSAVLLTVAGLFYWSIAVAQSSGDPEGLDLTDTDGDLLSDQWEEHYFGNLNQNGSGDFDLDDVIDADEYALGSDPSLANPRTLGESGTVLIKQGDREHWHAVSLTGIYENPVVVGGTGVLRAKITSEYPGAQYFFQRIRDPAWQVGVPWGGSASEGKCFLSGG